MVLSASQLVRIRLQANSRRPGPGVTLEGADHARDIRPFGVAVTGSALSRGWLQEAADVLKRNRHAFATGAPIHFFTSNERGS